MLKDITIGQYYPVKSVIHSLDARVKIFGVLLFIISVFALDSVFSYCLASAFFACCIILSKVPLKYMLRGLKPLWIIILCTIVLNIFITKGTVVFEFAFFTVTREGIYIALKTALRFIYIIIFASIMTLTTTQSRLLDGIESILKPLEFFKFPVHEISMMMSIALRFIPLMVGEADRIMKAQASRGVDFKKGNIIKRIKKFIPIIMPLFASTVRRSNELAQAMEARCYRGGVGRTKMIALKYKKKDFAAYGIIAVYLVLIFVLK